MKRCLDNGKHSCTPKHTLGTLEQPPLEITYMVLTQLDIRSLTDFRRVTQRAMQVVDSIPQYKNIILHAPDTIRGSLSTGSAKFFSCLDLYDALCKGECVSCGKIDEFLYLITCRRVCFDCFNKRPQFLPLIQTDAQRKFGLSRKDLAALPSMRCIPGWYSHYRGKTCNRITLIDHYAAREAGIAKHGSVSAMEQFVADTLEQKMARYRTRVEDYLSLYGTEERDPREPKTQDEPDDRVYNPKRYMGIIHAPVLNF